MRDEIEAEAAAARAKTGAQPLGRKAILTQHPHHKPETMKKSPKPRIHAASHATRWWFYECNSLFTWHLLSVEQAIDCLFSDGFEAGDLSMWTFFGG